MVEYEKWMVVCEYTQAGHSVAIDELLPQLFLACYGGWRCDSGIGGK